MPIQQWLTSLFTGSRIKLLNQSPLLTMQDYKRNEEVHNRAHSLGYDGSDSSPGGVDGWSSDLSPITKDALVGGSTTGDNTAGSSGQETSFLLQSRDLPSRRLLGKGLSAIGYETIWNGERFARKDFIGVPRDIFEKEAGVLVGLKLHKNLVKTYGWTVDKRSCSLVLEYMDDDLLSLLQQKTAINQDQGGVGSPSTSSTSKPLDNLSDALDTILQIARGMESLHEQGVAHGDLKTKNILVTHGDQNSKVVKVTDFGLVWTKRKSQSKVSSKVRKLNIVQWRAPEYLEMLFRQSNLSNDEDGTSSESDSDSESNKTSSPSAVNVRLSRVDVFAADVYSFGVVCSQILTGKDPYPTLNWIDLGNKILSS